MRVRRDRYLFLFFTLVACDSKPGKERPITVVPLALAVPADAGASVPTPKPIPADAGASVPTPTPPGTHRVEGLGFTVDVLDGWELKTTDPEQLKVMKGNQAAHFSMLEGDEAEAALQSTRTDADCQRFMEQFETILNVANPKGARISSGSRYACSMKTRFSTIPGTVLATASEGSAYVTMCTNFENDDDACERMSWSIRRAPDAKPIVQRNDRVEITTLADKRIRVSGLGVALVLPAGWRVSPADTPTALFSATNDANHAMAVNLDDKPFTLSTTAACKARGEEVRTAFRAPEVSTTIAKTTHGPTCIVSVRSAGSEMTMRMFARPNGGIVGFTCSGPSNEAHRATCDEVFATWKFD